MGMRLMRPKDIRAARRRSKGEIVEKSRKKELKKLAAQRQRDAFEKSLPMDRAEFERLFEFLGEGLAHRGCDGTHRLTLEFLRARRALNETAVLDFCEQNGGYCACEVLNNVQDRFEF